MKHWQSMRLFAYLLTVGMVALLPFLNGCQPIQRPTPVAEVMATAEATATPEPTATPTPVPALPPTALQIPALGLQLSIVPMGWVVTTDANGQPSTRWIVPTDAVGWHVNSAGAGAAGNVILSGHQSIGAAVFAPLSLGDIQAGQEIELTDAAGSVFLYRVLEVTEPLPIVGATEADVALAQSYVAPGEQAKLTLITGWPDFTTSHRVFATAELVGRK